MARARVAVIGLGNMGRRHARTLEEMPGVELVGVLDAAVTAHGHDRFKDLGSVSSLGGMRLDYCVIATPTITHLPIALEVANMGISFLVEKPVAETAEAAKVIAGRVDETGVVARVGHIERFNPAVLAARGAIESGQFGRILQVVSKRQGPDPLRITDVGVSLDLATHDLDLVPWLLGSRYADLSAKIGSVTQGSREDYAIMVGELNSGTVVSHVVNWICPFKERQIMIYGTELTMRIDLLAMDVEIFPGDRLRNEWDSVAAFRGATEGSSTRLAIHRREPLVTEHEHMIQALAGEPDSCASVADGQYVVSMVETLLTKWQEGKQLSRHVSLGS